MRELEGKCVLYGLKHCAWTPSEATCDEWVSDESEVEDKTDLISRADAIEALGEEPEIILDTDAEWEMHDRWVDAMASMKSLPSAEPKTGEWIDVNGDGSLWRCDQCKDTACCKGNFCPNCGAKMFKKDGEFK